MEQGYPPNNQSNQPYPETRNPIRHPMTQSSPQEAEMHRVPDPPTQEGAYPRTTSYTDEDFSFANRDIPEGTFCGQFFASVKKNIIHKSREKLSCCLEVFLPVLFVLGLVGIWSATSAKYVNGKSFINETYVASYGDVEDVRFLFCTNNTHIPGYMPCEMVDPTWNVTFPTPEGPMATFTCVPLTSNQLCFNYTLGMALAYLYIGYDWDNTKAVPSFDAMIHILLLARTVIPFQFADAQYQSVYSGAIRAGKLHFVDYGTGRLSEVLAYLSAQTPLFDRYIRGNIYNNSVQANADVGTVANEGKTWGILQLNTITSSVFDITIQMNSSGIPGTDEVLNRFSSGGLGNSEFKLYYASGFLSVQRTMNEYYYRIVKGQTPPNAPEGAPMPYIRFKRDDFLLQAGSLAPLLIVLSFLYPVSQQTKRIVEEKEKRIREAMMIMGLGTGSFYGSWILTYILLYLVTSIIATVILKLTLVSAANGAIVFFLYFFFCLSCITLSGLISSFFSKSRIAATLSPLVFFVIAVPFFASDDIPGSALPLLSLLSPTAFAVGINLVFKYELATGISTADMTNSQDQLNMAAVYFFLLFDTVIYFLLTLYFDGVLPNEWGTTEHPCFCYIKCFGLCSSKKNASNGVANDARDPRGAYEPDPKGRPSVQLLGLRREFERGNERFVAVNDLTFNLYEGQITVLLGHNGAGKTTAINLMTGMLEPTSGDCIVYGKSIVNQMRAVRQEIGFCPQHNILWGELTCREHLEYFGKLKGLSGQQLEDAVIEMLKAVDLLDKIDYPSENLSGGQKRKLSVAIAFVGGSRVVFLDEPTAGMDVSARRFTWDLIRRMSVGRTIVLTTHYMDEADLLGNSIAIMSKGKLKCKGSSLFLKSRLGVGYSLSIAVDAAAQFDSIETAIKGHIPSAETLGSGSGELAYRLPMSEVPNFPPMLAVLEQQGPAMGIRNYGISVTTMEEVFLNIASDADDEAQLLSPGSPSPASPVPDEEGENAWAFYRSQESSLGRQFHALVTKRFHNIKRDRRTQCFQIVTPIVSIIIAMLFTLIPLPASPETALTSTMYVDPVTIDYANCPGWNASVFDSNVFSKKVNVTSPTAFDNYLTSTFKAHEFLRMTSFYCNESLGGRPVMFYNTSIGIHNAPEALQQYYQAFGRARGLATKMVTKSQPLKLTDREKAYVDSIITLIIGIFIMIPFTFVPSTFVSWVVKERECKAKHLQTISGMNFVVYWLANFVFDILSFLLTEALAILVFAIFSRKEYIGTVDNFFATFVLFFFYGLAGVSGSYFASFAFDNHASAQNIVMLTNFICGFLLVILNYFLILFQSTKSAGEVLQYIFRVVPSYCLGEGIINLATGQLLATLGQARSPWDLKVVGWPLIYLAIEFPLFSVLTFVLDHPARQRKAQQLFHEPDVVPPPIPDEDEDVARERFAVESGARPDDVVVVRHLCKVYSTSKSPKVAVKNLSFGVRPGEVFGFLGTNGAGKTTTTSILCGEQLPTHGRGWVSGHDVVDDAIAARFAVGYCPQFDALLDLLTAEEHLRLYAGLRGLAQDHIDAVVHSLIKKAGLEEHRNTLSMNMSGGNKRKLSVAIALIGAPLVVFLDEPSAGMDPMARRGLWNVIETIASKCSVVLTTHHLEEVEALANRVAIMVNGELRCIGNLQHLKHKFGSGFEMSIRVASDTNVAPFRQFIAANFPTARETEFRNHKFTFALGPRTRLSETFAMIESVKSQLGVTDYSVSQTSLEQVFLRIGADATEEE